MIFSIDAETWSYVNLQSTNADVYTREPRTRCLMLCWHPVGSINEPVRLWLEGQPPPYELVQHVRNGGRFAGWNVNFFDRSVYSRILVTRHGFPPVADDAWLDSMHNAAHANLPRSLAGASEAVGVPFQEDLKDKNRLRRITNANRTVIPAPVVTILGDPEAFDPKLVDDLRWLAARCLQDVPMEEQVLGRLVPWPANEPWLAMPAIDRRINDRGVFIDVPLVEGLAKAAVTEIRRLDGIMRKVTDGAVDKCTKIESLKLWLVQNKVELPPSEPPKDEDEEHEDEEEEEEEEETKGASRKSPWRLRKSDLADLLARTDISDKCHEALALRAEAAKVSVHKLRKMLQLVVPDGRIYQAFNLFGAQATGRWSAGKAQFHNFVRDTFANFDETAELNGLDPKQNKVAVGRLRDTALTTAIEVGRTGDADLMRSLYSMERKDMQGRPYHQGVLMWISRMLRSTLCAPDEHSFLHGDYANIEARIPVWLAGQENVIDQFARGEDVYRAQASPVYGISPEALSKEQRQIGKVMTLFLGFAGGVRAFVPAAMNYGVRISLLDGAKYVQAFRQNNAYLVGFWNNSMVAATMAICEPNREFFVPPKGLVSWIYRDRCLMCRLPSGRYLRYWGAHLVQGKWPDGQPKNMPDIRVLVVKGSKALFRTLWRGLAIENITQAIAADMLATALANMDKNGLPVVLHCHDSIAAEVAAEQANQLLPAFKDAMLAMPDWTKGLPIAVDAHYGARFA